MDVDLVHVELPVGVGGGVVHLLHGEVPPLLRDDTVRLVLVGADAVALYRGIGRFYLLTIVMKNIHFSGDGMGLVAVYRFQFFVPRIGM